MAKTAEKKPFFWQLTEKEKNSVHVVHLEDGRQVYVPSVIYDHIRESGWKNGVAWGWAHPKKEGEK